MQLSLPVPELFSFAQNLSYLERSPLEILYTVQNGKVYRAIDAEGTALVVEIGMAADDSALLVRFLGDGPPPGAAVRAAATRYVRRWFDLDTDLRPFDEMAQKDTLLQEPARLYRGLRIAGIPDLFEAISWGILGQQINLPFAYTLKRRLIEQYGRRLEAGNQSYAMFPTPERIAGLSVEELRPLQLSSRKSEYLIHVAQLIGRGELSREGLLAEGDLARMEQALVRIRGIGPWTANYVLMRCLQMPTAFPIADVGLHLALKQALGWDRKPTIPEIRELAGGWSGWEAYATFYMWRLLY
nr:DNA-3-methyladenine glycosylase [Paenibacillus daejeonensis]